MVWERSKKSMFYAVATSIIYMSMVIAVTWYFMPYLIKLSDSVVQQRLKDWITELGFGGILLMLGIQILQTIVAFIPGEPVEILSGLLYGTWSGMALCLLGCVIASIFVFSMVRSFGMPLVQKIFGKDKLEEFKFLKGSRQIQIILFILFLIPGTPKDTLTYIAGISNLKISRFLLISTFARIPSLLSSTIVGSTMRDGEWGIAAVVFGGTALIGVIGIRYKDSIIEYCRRICASVKERTDG